jgi:predicted small secreted protein
MKKMKNTIKLIGIIALVAVIGFSMIACNNGSTGGVGKTNIGGNNTGGSTISGTYVTDFLSAKITFTGSNYSASALGEEFHRGSFTVSGNTITCKVTWASSIAGANVGDILIFTIIDANTIKEEDGGFIYTKI